MAKEQKTEFSIELIAYGDVNYNRVVVATFTNRLHCFAEACEQLIGSNLTSYPGITQKQQFNGESRKHCVINAII